MFEQDRLLTRQEAAERLNTSRGWLAKMAISGAGPKFLKLGRRCVRYRESDLTAWIESRIRTSTSDVGGNDQ
ncbi:MAG: helix-turn-helix transcriptional regulator [Alphaproteobacteria bacterium]